MRYVNYIYICINNASAIVYNCNKFIYKYRAFAKTKYHYHGNNTIRATVFCKKRKWAGTH